MRCSMRIRRRLVSTVAVAVAATATDSDVAWMRLALQHARRADAEDCVPVGCVLVQMEDSAEGRIARVDCFRNGPRHFEHAELLAVMALPSFVRNPRTALYVSLEPCVMCAGAIALARIPRLVYGARNPLSGGTTALLAGKPIAVVGGVLAQESSALLSSFFKRQRSLA